MTLPRPHSTDAEVAVLGACILDFEACTLMVGMLRPEHFYHSPHHRMFEAICVLVESGVRPDIVTVSDEMDRRGSPMRQEIRQAIDAVPASTNCEYYAEIVLEKYNLRRASERASDIIDAVGNKRPLDEVAAMPAPQDFEERGKDAVSLHDIVTDVWDRYERGDHGTYIPTGLDILDDALDGGLWLPEFTIVAGRPSSGKSSLVGYLAQAIAKQGHDVLFVSLEMSPDLIVRRFIAAEGGHPFREVRRGEADISGACGKLADLPIRFIDVATVAEIVGVLGAAKVVIVDYFQLMRVPAVAGVDERTDQGLARLARNLFREVKGAGAHLLLCSQLNRNVEHRGKNAKPMQSDLRECVTGDTLVYDADVGREIRVDALRPGTEKVRLWGVDERLQIAAGTVRAVWPTGKQEAFHLTTKSGRELVCTAGHRLLCGDNLWRRLDALTVGDEIAVTRVYPSAPPSPEDDSQEQRAVLLGWLLGDGYLGGTPTLTVSSLIDGLRAAKIAEDEFNLQPHIKIERLSKTAHRIVMTTGRMCGAGKNPLTRWLRDIGVWGKRGCAKEIPAYVFYSSPRVIAGCLRGLFHADGSITKRKGKSGVQIRFTNISERLCRQAAHLLLRLGIVATIHDHAYSRSAKRSDVERIWTVGIYDRAAASRFLSFVGFLGDKHIRALTLLDTKRNRAGHIDRMPRALTEYAWKLKRERGLEHKDFGWVNQGKRMSRERAAATAERLSDPIFRMYAEATVFWDEIAEIQSVGLRETYDLDVSGTHSFAAGDILAHNCGALEECADNLIFTHRIEGGAQLIIGKQRNGQVGELRGIKVDHSRMSWASEYVPPL